MGGNIPREISGVDNIFVNILQTNLCEIELIWVYR